MITTVPMKLQDLTREQLITIVQDLWGKTDADLRERLKQVEASSYRAGYELDRIHGFCNYRGIAEPTTFECVVQLDKQLRAANKEQS